MSGRSRGRARVRTDAPPPPLSPGDSAPTPPQQPQLPAITPAIVPESGRGRGITSPSIVTTTPSTTGTEKSSSSEESPPQQISPTSSSNNSAAPQTLGRAALRGAPHVPGVTVRSELLPPMERLQLQDPGSIIEEQKREVRYDSVLYTKPDSCAGKQGTGGTEIKILTNYFEIDNKPDWILYQYHVDFAPIIDNKSMRIALLRNHDDKFNQNKAFDGSTLYSLTKLPEVVNEWSSIRQSDNEKIIIKIKRVGEIIPTSPQFIHLFNLVLRRCLKLYGMQEIDRSYFDMKKKQMIPAYNLEFINGITTSIACYESKLLLCAELTHKLLHKNTIHNMMDSIFRECRSELEFKEKCTLKIIGRIVMTNYNNKTYKIDDIDWMTNPTSSFNTRRGEVSFIDYYKNNYDITIRDKRQPLLISLPSGKDKRRAEQIGQEAKPALLIPELCVITGVDGAMRMDFKFKRELEKFSRVDADKRCERLENFVNNFKTDEKVKNELAKWEMNFKSTPTELVGRVLPPESLMFGNGVIKQLNEKADWGNDMKSCRLLKSIRLTNWIIVYPTSKKNAASIFLNTYSQIISNMGIEANRPKEIQVQQDSPEQLANSLKQNITDQVQIVVVIVSSKRKDRYDAIKRVCCLERPVPSQVCTSMIIEDQRKSRSVVTKVAIQMNCKLGGEVWQSNIPVRNLMICGIDTYHDSAIKHGSVCAFIATSNPTYTKFFSRATIQETHQELSSNLSITVKSACEHYKKMNNVYPEKLIIYRDGISDGQLAIVKEHEIPQIEKAFSMIDANYKPKLCVIIVKKSGNTRFFAQTGRNLMNPPCGSVIDTVVTRSEWFDFYLISQCVTQGTVNPTHYNIIHDTIGMKADHYQKLSFKLTHMYYNWPGTIRVPSMCQYAHKLAFLVGQSLHKEHHSSLCDKLFYL